MSLPLKFQQNQIGGRGLNKFLKKANFQDFECNKKFQELITSELSRIKILCFHPHMYP